MCVCVCVAEDDYSQQDQVKVFSHEGDGENTEHLNSMDLHDIKTELERDAEKAEVCVCGWVGGASTAQGQLKLFPPFTLDPQISVRIGYGRL